MNENTAPKKGANKKGIIIAIVVAVVLLAAALLCWKLWSPTAQVGSKTVTVQVVHADGSERDFTLHTDALYLWDAMTEQELIDGTDSDYGKWVTTVDGEVADEAAGLYWMFTKGGEWVNTSCDTTPIAHGEGYEFFLYDANAAG
jgi:hypothetical protein